MKKLSSLLFIFVFLCVNQSIRASQEDLYVPFSQKSNYQVPIGQWATQAREWFVPRYQQAKEQIIPWWQQAKQKVATGVQSAYQGARQRFSRGKEQLAEYLTRAEDDKLLEEVAIFDTNQASRAGQIKNALKRSALQEMAEEDRNTYKDQLVNLVYNRYQESGDVMARSFELDTAKNVEAYFFYMLGKKVESSQFLKKLVELARQKDDENFLRFIIKYVGDLSLKRKDDFFETCIDEVLMSEYRLIDVMIDEQLFMQEINHVINLVNAVLVHLEQEYVIELRQRAVQFINQAIINNGFFEVDSSLVKNKALMYLGVLKQALPERNLSFENNLSLSKILQLISAQSEEIIKTLPADQKRIFRRNMDKVVTILSNSYVH